MAHLVLGWWREPRPLWCHVLVYSWTWHPGTRGLPVWLYRMWLRWRKAWRLPLLICIQVPSPPLLSGVFVLLICKTGLPRLVISPWSLFLLISLQNRSTWTPLSQSLTHSPCQGWGSGCSVCIKRDQAVKFRFYMLIALSGKKIPFKKTARKC